MCVSIPDCLGVCMRACVSACHFTRRETWGSARLSQNAVNSCHGNRCPVSVTMTTLTSSLCHISLLFHMSPARFRGVLCFIRHVDLFGDISCCVPLLKLQHFIKSWLSCLLLGLFFKWWKKNRGMREERRNEGGWLRRYRRMEKRQNDGGTIAIFTQIWNATRCG